MQYVALAGGTVALTLLASDLAPSQTKTVTVERPVLVEVPDQATKTRALKRGYELNGNSMVRPLNLGSIDVSEEGEAARALSVYGPKP